MSKTAMDRLQLSARAFDRILKVAHTAADLGGSGKVRMEDLSEAIHYRSLDREGWIDSIARGKLRLLGKVFAQQV